MIRPFLCLSLLVLSSVGNAVEPTQAKLVALLKDKRIDESSGLTQSLRDPQIFWTHNDSGSDPCLYAINQSGQTLAKVRLSRAVNFDWEDMASARDADGHSNLYVADCGDNLLARASLQVYQIPEPELPEDVDRRLQKALSHYMTEVYRVNSGQMPINSLNQEACLVLPLRCPHRFSGLLFGGFDQHPQNTNVVIVLALFPRSGSIWAQYLYGFVPPLWGCIPPLWGVPKLIKNNFCSKTKKT